MSIDEQSAQVEQELKDEPFEAAVLRTETGFEGAIWDVRRDNIDFGGQRLTREYLEHPGAVAVLALDDEDRVLLIKQYRHPVRMREWEIPAGLLDVQGEGPLAAAQRELAEETELQAEHWHVLVDYLSSPGASSEALRIYLARGLSATAHAYERDGEEADMEVRWMPLDETARAVLERRVHNPSLTVGVLAALASRAGGWASLGDANEPWAARPGPS